MMGNHIGHDKYCRSEERFFVEAMIDTGAGDVDEIFCKSL